jgi:hypothetical protein
MSTDKSATVPAIPPVPIDQYKTPDFPLIGATVAVACGELPVREAFWADGRSFCTNLYGLSPKHTELLMLPEGNPVNDQGICIPTAAEINVLIEELNKVLEKSPPASGPVSTTPPAFDPDFERAYPTIVQVYLAMQFQIGQVPDDWQSRMRSEFNAFPWPW